MAKRSALEKLPAGVKKWLEEQLASNGFSEYTEITKQLNEMGISIGRSSVHRFGYQLQERLKDIKEATEAAKIIEAQAVDAGDALGGAVMGMVKTELFNVMVDLKKAEGEEDSAERAVLLSKVAKSVADLSRASIAQKKHAAETAEKIDAKLKALEAESTQVKGKGKLDAETLRRVRTELYGIV